MWYDNILKKMQTERSYSRQELYSIFASEKKELSQNSFHWIIASLVESGNLTRCHRGMYQLPKDISKMKKSYKPEFRETTVKLIQKLEQRFPLVDFVCFESVQLNEFLNHLIAQNTVFLMTERDVVESFFRYLQEEKTGNVLLKPSICEWDHYWTSGSIVLLNWVSEAPKNTQAVHEVSLEQLLVDIIAEKTMQLLYSRNEIDRIYKTANEIYQIDRVRLMRYARRRGKAEEVEKIWKG